jgi:nucleotide-binding universal stress UspA family protein
MGARGVKGVKLLFLGSSTRSVALNSPKPLLVVKKSPWSHRPFRVLFATDGSETADEAGRFLAAMPLSRDTEMTVMHVTWSAFSEIPQKFIAELGDQIEGEESWFRTVGYGRAEEILGRARSYLGERFPRMNFLTKAGDPSGQILEAEKSIETDLIVVGCRGVRGLRGMMGSVSRRILSHSRSSILIGRPCAPTD